MIVLVTGGAGYIGSVVADQLIRHGHQVVVLDNLAQGHRQAVPEAAKLVEADICGQQVLDRVLGSLHIDAVMHMAAETVVARSNSDPKRFFHTNVVGSINLLDAMLKHDVHKLILSSTAAVYGDPHADVIREDHPTNPINAYGRSKLMFEQILHSYGEAYGMSHLSLRYFNAAGATGSLGEDHDPETHLIPNILRAALDNKPVTVFGTDYPTVDGTCVRDYIHVIDIARAHVVALERLDTLNGKAYNLGNQKGYSVIEVIETAKKVTGVNLSVKVGPRRSGDPATLVAGSDRASAELGWKPQLHELESMIESAWGWMSRHPHGYTY